MAGKNTHEPSDISSCWICSVQMEDEEISFDPTEFFMNSALASAAGASGTDINNDLQVSDSDEDGDEKDEAPLIPTENQNNEGFDIDEYL